MYLGWAIWTMLAGYDEQTTWHNDKVTSTSIETKRRWNAWRSCILHCHHEYAPTHDHVASSTTRTNFNVEIRWSNGHGRQ